MVAVKPVNTAIVQHTVVIQSYMAITKKTSWFPFPPFQHYTLFLPARAINTL
jgi:hypothetical protein